MLYNLKQNSDNQMYSVQQNYWKKRVTRQHVWIQKENTPYAKAILVKQSCKQPATEILGEDIYYLQAFRDTCPCII